MTLVVVTSLAVNEEDSKVQDVEVGDEHAPSLSFALNNLSTVSHNPRAFGMSSGAENLIPGKTGRETIGPRLDPIAQVVDVTGDSPPACREKLAALLGLDVLEVRDSGVVGVGSEAVLLVVG